MITITIGRNDQNSVQIAEDFRRVSRNHGKIDVWENGELKLTDFSTYGTTINGKLVQNDTVDIKIGDEIILGGECTLNWGIIEKFLPKPQTMGNSKETIVFYGNDNNGNDNKGSKETVIFYGNDKDGDNTTQNGKETVFNNTTKNGKETVILGDDSKINDLYRTTGDVVVQKGSSLSNTNSESFHSRSGKYWSNKEVNSFLKKWNWGAFFLSFVWGCFHKIYWPLYILAANLVVSVLPFLMKGDDLIIAVAIITWIVHLAVFVAAVYLGINGSELAWKLGVCNKDLSEFKKKEKRWTTAGFITFGVGILAIIVATIFLIDKM